MKELLAGQLLWTIYDDLWPPAIISLGILGVWFKSGSASNSTLFYALFALSVTLSVQLVGVYLVFASLIIPALTTRGRRSLTVAFGIGLAGYLLGLLGSMATDLPTGPSVVRAMAMVGMMTAFMKRLKARVKA